MYTLAKAEGFASQLNNMGRIGQALQRSQECTCLTLIKERVEHSHKPVHPLTVQGAVQKSAANTIIRLGRILFCAPIPWFRPLILVASVPACEL